ncbi:MAG: hypothetical protein O9282_09505 [Flavobacterium sp.]|jgi:hypothetical protein|uniref:hypothetical protein n=1 Tax=Flavobacterium sp. TaxID=239 RepID=UPI0022C3D199|nr:hypothetical protein [Flavobacterium sp.]MCZ8331534.1 hypothetical protein [Flavobacterium sp.]
MEYEKYWSIADLGTNSLKSYEVCLCIAILFILFFILTKKFKKSNQDYERTIILWSTGLIGIGAFLGFVYLRFYTIDTTEERIQKTLNSEYVAVVEGTITNFESVRPISRRGIVTQESFVVDSVDFSYSDEVLGRFNRFSKTNNGVFRNGLPVRITYGKERHEILMVEIKK